MLTTVQAATIEQFGIEKETHVHSRWTAAKWFDREYLYGRLNRLWAKLTRKKHDLRGLPHGSKTDRPTTGIVVVPLSKIVGTEGRCEDFDADFRPLNLHNRERWINIATARQTGINLPAVELLQIEDKYYVRDGHHRISVAKVMGQLEMDARIVN